MAVSAMDEHLDSGMAAYIDWDHYVLHGVHVGEHGSSYHSGTLITNL